MWFPLDKITVLDGGQDKDAQVWHVDCDTFTVECAYIVTYASAVEIAFKELKSGKWNKHITISSYLDKGKTDNEFSIHILQPVEV